MTEKEYTRRDVERVTGLSGENIQFLIRTNLVAPERRSGPGRGRAYIFGLADIVTCAMINLLKGYEGISSLRLQPMFEDLRKKDAVEKLRFFTDDSWGGEQELVYFWSERKGPSPNIIREIGTRDDLVIVPIVDGVPRIPPITLAQAGKQSAVLRILYLGRAKLDAMETLKI